MVLMRGVKVKRPALVCDIDGYVIIKIGEYEDMLHYYKELRKVFNSLDYARLNRELTGLGLPKVTIPIERTIELIELPGDQNIIDNIINNSGCLKKYLDGGHKKVTKINFEPIR